MTTQPWWRPELFARRKANLDIRRRVAGVARDYFAREDFAEVDTPALQVSPGGEVHLRAFKTRLLDPHGCGRSRDAESEPELADAAQTLYLHTSPELAMKKLLVAGMPRIYQLAHAFRNAERSSRHHPEFMMLEWYRSRDSGFGIRDSAAADQSSPNAESRIPNPDLLNAIKQDCVNLIRAAAQAAGRKTFAANGMTCDPFKEWENLGVPDAFKRYAGIDLLATAPNPHAPDAALLAKEARRIGARVAEGDTWDDLFFRIMLEKIEPQLGKDAPTFLCDYPVSMAALARPKPGDPRLAERFELYICGIELANAFGELTDADEQERRFRADMDLKEKLYGERYPVDEDFIAALRHGMPESAGIALGFDRLVMLCAGAEKIDDVLWATVCSR